MKFKLTLLALIAGASMVAQAQTPAASAPTRAEVKAETAAANKAGKIPNPDTAGSTVSQARQVGQDPCRREEGNRCGQQGRRSGQA